MEAFTGLSVLCLLVGPGAGDVPVPDRHQTKVPVVMMISEKQAKSPFGYSAGCMVNLMMQASLLSSLDAVPTARWIGKLHLCEQDYHKLLEFFFLRFCSSKSVISSGGGPIS
jgi:hypothetical protein